MSDYFDNTDHVIMVGYDLATEENVSSRTRSKSNIYGSPKISTPLKSHNTNKTTDSNRAKKSRSNNNKLEEKFPTTFGIFDYKKDSRDEVMEWLNKNNDINKNVVYINSESISAEKLFDLCDKEIWLSSDHINAYLSYLNTRFYNVFSLPSFFYTKLTTTGRYEYSSVVRWTKRTEIFQKEIIFVPIIVDESHWILAAIFMKDPCRIAILDSLGILTDSKAVTIGKNLVKWLNDEYRFKHKAECVDEDDECENYKVNGDLRTVSLDSNKSTRKSSTIGDTYSNDDSKSFTLDIMFRKKKPPQVDGCSCGVFVCMFARLMAEKVERETIIDIAKFQEATTKFRKVMCTDLWDYAKENNQIDMNEVKDEMNIGP